MSTSHEESWLTATHPRWLLKLTRVRPSGRQYLLLACAAIRRLVPGPRTEMGLRILDALERFAAVQPRKGVQTHLWNEVVRRAVPEIPDPIPFNWQKFRSDGPWAALFTYRLRALSCVSTAEVNVVLDLAFRQAEVHAGGEAATEVAALVKRLGTAPGLKAAARLTAEELRDEIVSRVVPQRRVAFRAAWDAAPAAAYPAAYLLVGERVRQRTDEVNARACNLVREVFGNPFRPPGIDPAWLTWNHGAVRHIAESIAATGDFTDLPILGDALEDAGCCHEELLQHLRSGTAHAPGCWALDAVLGR